MAPTKKHNFEKQMERLQTIVAELEKGTHSLENNIALYQEGLALAKSCRNQLEKARHMVLVQEGEQLREFSHQEGEGA